MQKTLKGVVDFTGVGLHSGYPSHMSVKPAPAGTGIVFKRTDLPETPEIKALYSNVADTRNCTCIAAASGAAVSTIEHIMAALAVAEINNAVIEVDNLETPIMDGSGKIFYEALLKTGCVEQDVPEKFLKITKEVVFADDKGCRISLSPAEDFYVDFEIDFPSKIVGHQTFSGRITPEVFASEIAPCRTFCEKYQVDYLQSIGLIKGGSLENAVVLDGEKILNPEGFRVKNECVNHKVLDAVGDMFTSGFRLKGHLRAFKTGHYHNNELLKILFSDKANYEIVEA